MNIEKRNEYSHPVFEGENINKGNELAHEIEESSTKDIRRFTRSYSSVERTAKAQELRGIPKDQREEELESFYKEQEAIRVEFLETLDERQVEDIMNQYDVIFTHGIPLDSMKNTSHNNTVIDTESIKLETKIKLILGFQPTISACVIKVSEQSPNAHYYKFGLMIGRGTVMLAHNRDTATVAENMYSRRLKDGEYNKDGEKNSYINGKNYSFFPENMVNHSIQTNIQENIRQAIEEPVGGKSGDARNEVVIENPDAIGFYIDLNTEIGDVELIQIVKIARNVGLPIFGLKNGRIFSLQDNGQEEINLDELHISEELTEQKRLKYIEDTIQDNVFVGGKIPIEAERRISSLKSKVKEISGIKQESLVQQGSEELYPDFEYLDGNYNMFYNADLMLKGTHSRYDSIPKDGNEIVEFFTQMGVRESAMTKVKTLFENKDLSECRKLIDSFLNKFYEAKKLLAQWKQSKD
jgi:hypothetical protein